jgi:hypothetical protein
VKTSTAAFSPLNTIAWHGENSITVSQFASLPFSPTLAETSGSDVLDQAALNAIQESRLFVALPAGFTGDQLVLRIRFSYNEK